MKRLVIIFYQVLFLKRLEKLELALSLSLARSTFVLGADPEGDDVV